MKSECNLICESLRYIFRIYSCKGIFNGENVNFLGSEIGCWFRSFKDFKGLPSLTFKNSQKFYRSLNECVIWQSLLISFKVPLASFLHHDNFNSLAYVALFKYQELRTNAIAKPLELNELESGIKKSAAAVKVLMNQRSCRVLFSIF